MSTLIGDLVSALADYLRKRPSARAWTGWICLVILVLAIGSLTAVVFNPFVYGRFLFDKNTVGPFLVIIAFVAFFGLGVVAASFLDPDRLSEANEETQAVLKILGLSASIGGTRTRASTSTKAAEKGKDADDILDAIKLNLAQVVEYYVINKGQAKSSFRMSAFAIITGFLTIIVGVWLSYTNQLTNQNPAYISVLAGVVLQFIGGAYFYLYNRSLIQLNFFFSRLALMQDTMLAIRLCDSIPEGKDKHHVLERLIFQIVSRDSHVPDYLAEARKRPTRERSPEAEKPSAAKAKASRTRRTTA